MPIKEYARNPEIVEAIQFTNENKDRAFNFVQCNRFPGFDSCKNPVLHIQTKRGIRDAVLGDYIVRVAPGNYKVFPPEDFEATFSEVE